MSRATVWAPVLAAAFGVAWFAVAMRTTTEPPNEMQLSKFGRLPVLDGGRKKPIDTYARIQLSGLSNRQEYYQEYYKTVKNADGKPVKDADGNDKKELDKKERRSALQWLLNLMAEGYVTTGIAVEVPPEVQELLKLPARNRRGLFGPDQVIEAATSNPEIQAIVIGEKGKVKVDPQTQMALRMVLMDAKDKSDKLKKVLDARQKLGTPDDTRVFRIENDQVTEMLGLTRREGLRYTLEEIGAGKKFQEFQQKAASANDRPEKERELEDVKVLELFGHLRTHYGVMQMEGNLRTRMENNVRIEEGDLKIVPGTAAEPKWKTLGQALRDGDADGNPPPNPAAKALKDILEAYSQGDAPAFNKAVDSYTKTLDAMMPSEMAKVRREAWFNSFAPFYQCSLLYVVVLLLAVGSWIVWHEPLRRAAFSLAVVVWVVHTAALIVRIYITMRPPVTNLYSSAVFIGWGCVLLCLILEYVASRNRFAHSIPLVVASVLGFVTMIIAHHLGGSGDSMEVMQAVLDTNFWLATHVTTVTLGYTATFVAGFVAMVFVFMMLATAVRSYFTTRHALAGAELGWFVASVCGLVAIPCGAAAVLLGGLWMLLSDGEPLDAGTILVLSIPMIAAGGFYAALTISKRLSAEYAGGGEMPKVAHVVDALALRQDTGKVLASLVYGVVCFALLLSFVGTVLGGIWADQSWGRFWGWDPKENGALLIVIMNALILHARWAGLVKERGTCVLALLGNMVTAWSWFGTNQLGVGLHAYGFNNTLAFGCTVFWFSQLGLIGLGLMPLRFWRAYADKPLVGGAAPAKTGAPRGPRLQSGGSTGIQPA